MFSPDINILVVDDMVAMRKLVQKSCMELGFKNFIEAKDGREAYSKIDEPNSSIGLVISDWSMPGATGLDLLKRIRASEKFKTLPFVMLTAEAEKSQILEAVQAGVNSYVVKPFTTEVLKLKLEAVHKKIASR